MELAEESSEATKLVATAYGDNNRRQLSSNGEKAFFLFSSFFFVNILGILNKFKEIKVFHQFQRLIVGKQRLFFFCNLFFPFFFLI